MTELDEVRAKVLADRAAFARCQAFGEPGCAQPTHFFCPAAPWKMTTHHFRHYASAPKCQWCLKTEKELRT